MQPAVMSCRLTSRQAMEANSDGGGPHWHAAGQAVKHWLNRVAFGLLAMEVHLLLQLHRFKFHVTLWKRVKREGKHCEYSCLPTTGLS